MLEAAVGAEAREVVVSVSAERRLRAAWEWLESRDEGELLIVAPSRRAADDFVREAALRVGRRSRLFGLWRTNPALLASDLATAPMASGRLAPVTQLGAEALTARSVHTVRGGEGLAYFEPVADTPGFPRALARTLRELRLETVDGEALAAAGLPGVDLRRLSDAFDAELGARELADQATLFRLATEVIRGGRHRLVGLPVLLLDAAIGSASEEQMFSALFAGAPGVFATAVAGDRSLARLARVTGVEPRDLDPEVPVTTALERMRRHVFGDAPTDATPDPTVELFSASGEGRECVEIARRVLQVAEASGAAAEGSSGARGGFDRIAILLRNPDGYQALLEDAMRRADIPTYFSRGTVRPDPSGRAFLALLACAAEGLSASRFSEYLSLGQVPRLTDDGAPDPSKQVPWVEPKGDQLVFKTLVEEPEPVDPGEPLPEEQGQNATTPVIAGTLQAPVHWERLLVDAAVVGGRERWQRRLRGLEEELALQLRDVAAEEESRRDHLERQLTRLRNLARFANPVIAALDALPQRALWGDWLTRLEALVGLVLRRPESVLSVLAELRPMADVGPVELPEVADVLTDRLAFLRVDPPKRRYGRVFVATIEEARGRSFDTVFLPGLAEGIFPRKAFEDPLLLDAARSKVAAGLVTQDDRVSAERSLLRIAAGAASSRLVVSYPRIDIIQGRSRVPSFYALDVLRAAEGQLPKLRDLEKRAAAAAAAPLGWPAPRDPGDAIDDAEYDLAVLEPLLRTSAEATQGRARYMVEVNERLARSLRTRWSRWRKSWSEADGIVDPDDSTVAALQSQLPTARSYSPTALQNYAACPYRFLLSAIHRLRPREEVVPLEQIDPLTRGSLFHEIAAELLRALKREELLPIVEERLDAVLNRADEVFDEIVEQYRERLAPAIPRVWRSEIEGLRTDMRGWLRNVVELGDRWVPEYFELAFGLPPAADRDPASDPEPVVLDSGVQLRGSIDLVELDPDTGHVRVTDYKTGKPPWKSSLIIQGGEVLQPLLYGLAAESMLGKKVEVGRLSYCTQRGEYKTVDVPLDDERRHLVGEVLGTIGKAVELGFLPAAPRERGCDYCDFKQVCGPYEEIRYSLKKRSADPRLEALDELRGRE